MKKVPANLQDTLLRISHPVVSIDEQGKILYGNDAAAELLNVQLEQLDGLSLWGLLAQYNRALEKACTGALVNMNHSTESGYLFNAATWCEADIYPASDGITIIVRRTTTNAANKEVAQYKERYRILFERTPYAVLIYNPVTADIIDANTATEELSGFVREQLLRMKITDFAYPGELEARPIAIDRLRAGETVVTRRAFKTNLGVKLMADVSSTLLPDGNVLTVNRELTDYSGMENVLSHSELRFRTLVNNLPVGIFETAAEGGTTYVNAALMNYMGTSFEESLGTGWTAYIHPDDRQVLVSDWQQKQLQREPATLHYRIVAKDGTLRWVQGRAVPVIDKNGLFKGYQGIVSDITKETLAYKALLQSEERYKALVEEAPDAIYIVDFNGNFISLNKAACAITGYTEEELMQKTVYEFISADDVTDNPFRFEDLKAGKTVQIQRKMQVKNGRVVYGEFRAKMLSDGNILVVGSDVTERKKAEEDLSKEKTLSDTIINSLPGIFFLLEPYGKLIRWNKNFESISGYTPEEMSQASMDGFFDQSQQTFEEMHKELLRKGAVQIEAMLHTKSGIAIPYLFTSRLILYEGKSCVLGMATDIIGKRKSEELLQKSYEDVQRLAAHLVKIRDEERRRIGREIHDELGQQLTAVKMDVAWMDKKISNADDPVKSKLRNVIALLDGSNKAVRRILTELNSGVVFGESLPDALERQANIFTATTGIIVHLYVDEIRLPPTPEVSNCVFRVFQESLTNIMRYARATKVTATVQTTDTEVQVKILDDGVGFDSNAAQNTSSFGILGMRERVLAHGGSFHITSEKGKGAVVIFSVPLSEANNENNPVA